jgi:lipopolysaccharide biosynthesis glycosyltransferase
VWQFINVEQVGVYFDADTIPIRDPSSLLHELDVPSDSGDDNNDDASHSREFGVVGAEYYFNTGVFVFRPSRRTYEALLHRLQYNLYAKDPNNPTEQDLLISHFGNHQNKSKFIDDSYNYRPYNQQAGWESNPNEGESIIPTTSSSSSSSSSSSTITNQPYIIHYIGNPKPWSYILGKSTSIDGLFTTIHDAKRTSLPLWSIQLYQKEMEQFFTRCI